MPLVPLAAASVYRCRNAEIYEIFIGNYTGKVK
jgi:hypothetical protein